MHRLLTVFFVSAALLGRAPVWAATVFSTDFESGLPPEFSAPGASIQGVQGYAGLGAPGNQFGGSFLRYDGTDVLDTTLTLTGLPPHDTISVGFLLAVIDSWDGTEVLEVAVDGVTLFSHTFQLATGDASSYDAPAGALLSSGTDLGFSAGSYYDHDRAYDLSVDPAFSGIPHTADSVTVTWRLVAAPGGGASFWQGDGDESWAIDNVQVAVGGPASTSTTTVPASSTTTTTTLPASSAQLLSGKKLLLKWRPDQTKKSLLSVLSKDATLTLGDGPGGSADPTVHGASVRVYAAGGDGFDDTYVVPAARCRLLSKRKPAGGYVCGKADPIVGILVKPGKTVKIVGKGTALGHSLAADPRPVLVELRLGSERYCFAFGGTVSFAPGKKYLAKDAGRASGCAP